MAGRTGARHAGAIKSRFAGSLRRVTRMLCMLGIEIDPRPVLAVVLAVSRITDPRGCPLHAASGIWRAVKILRLHGNDRFPGFLCILFSQTTEKGGFRNSWIWKRAGEPAGRPPITPFKTKSPTGASWAAVQIPFQPPSVSTLPFTAGEHLARICTLDRPFHRAAGGNLESAACSSRTNPLNWIDWPGLYSGRSVNV